MITIKSASELQLMKRAGEIVYLTHQALKKKIEPGITTLELDRIAERTIRKHNATPSFKGYNGFPGSVCISVNDELIHGIPSKRRLQEGDIVSIDVGANYRGYHGDSAWTYPVGDISDEAKQLLSVTESSLLQGLSVLKEGVRLGDLSHTIETVIEKASFSVVKEYVGHGVGSKLHEPPSVPNYGVPGKGVRLRKGMTLAVEPMVIAGKPTVNTLEDEWTVVSVDGTLCAHFEHTVAITEEGYEILTTARKGDG